MKNIVAFGDSFTLTITPNHLEWDECYQGMLANRYNCLPEFRGKPGTGPWYMFFDFLRYPDKHLIDVALIAWSEISRLYHPVFQPINTHIAHDKELFKKASDHERDVIVAANHYYQKLYDGHQKSYEMKALMNLFDDMCSEYKHIKFIHLPCFTWESPAEWWGETYKVKKPEDLVYYHNFKNGMEVRPALMYLSMLDEWPADLSQDRRQCHMTSRVNRLLADTIIQCIDNYTPGKMVEMDISTIK